MSDNCGCLRRTDYPDLGYPENTFGTVGHTTPADDVQDNVEISWMKNSPTFHATMHCENRVISFLDSCRCLIASTASNLITFAFRRSQDLAWCYCYILGNTVLFAVQSVSGKILIFEPCDPMSLLGFGVRHFERECDIPAPNFFLLSQFFFPSQKIFFCAQNFFGSRFF